ncbi:MAG: cytosine deaminase [Pseudomonadota bacterium]
MIPASGPYRLTGARVPAAMAEGLGHADAQGFVTCDLTVADGRIGGTGGPEIPIRGAIVLPGLVDCHTHLDKGHIWARKPNPDGTFMGALTSVAEDRGARWTAGDVRARIEFSLRSAYARGTVAIRTHLDSGDHRTASSWEMASDAREAWAGRITLQMAALTTLEAVESDAYRETADLVARHGGVLGAVTYPLLDNSERLRTFFRLAVERGLDVDFHADETLDPASQTLGQIADAVIETGYEGRVLCGHCCSLSTMAEAEADRILDRVAEAGLSIVSLPMCNLYLQDRVPGRTPRYRGITLVHEMRARGIPVSFASDNTRDPFYAYGDMDMLEVWREATRIAHLDHPVGDWPAAFASAPAQALGLEAGVIAEGRPADLIIVPGARSWTELLSRPHADRIVIRGGRAIDTTLPAYAELDPLMETP